jgi:DNA-binding MarR family transcriptional regulator
MLSTSEMLPLLVADVFQLAGAFRELGERIASKVGQTQARWQVLSVISDGPWTVAQAARRLGYARQSVQRTADQLTAAGLAQYKPNPAHAKSPLLQITREGTATLARITREAEKWHLQLGAHLNARDVSTTRETIRQLCDAVEGGLSKRKRRSGDRLEAN